MASTTTSCRPSTDDLPLDRPVSGGNAALGIADGNAALGIAKFQVQESDSEQVILGLDANSNPIARYEIKLGRFVMSPYLAEGIEGLEVPGRRIMIDVLGMTSYDENADYPDMTFALPQGSVAVFLRDPHVAPVLAGWGIHYRMPGPDLILVEQIAPQVTGCADCVSDTGYTGYGACKDITCGYLFGAPGTQHVTTASPAKLFSDPGGGCTNGCQLCANSTQPALYGAIINSEPSYGYMPRESFIAQMCQNPNETGPNFHSFFEVKACRTETDPVQCPSGGMYTSCGCTPSSSSKCKPCEHYASGVRGGRELYNPPYGEIDAGFSCGDPIVRPGRNDLGVALVGGEEHNTGALCNNHLEWSYHESCYPAENFCTLDSQCCSGSCNFGIKGWGHCN